MAREHHPRRLGSVHRRQIVREPAELRRRGGEVLLGVERDEMDEALIPRAEQRPSLAVFADGAGLRKVATMRDATLASAVRGARVECEGWIVVLVVASS